MVQQLPKNHDLGDIRIEDGRFQPLEYKWIKEIYIPNEYKPIENVGIIKKQNTKQILLVLENIGKFPIEILESGIKIVAYKK